jgi:hypothetical protein
LLRKCPNIKVNSALPWDDLTFREIVWVVQDYVNNSGDVTNEDPLQEWLDEYLFCSGQGVTLPGTERV